jgi:thiol-disulfide isomerase/thioredoxin
MTIPGPGPHRNDEPGRQRNDPSSASRFFDHPLLDLDRRPVTLAAFRGRLTLVDVWGTWCSYCIRGMPELIGLQRRYGNQGLVVIGISAEEKDDPQNAPQRIRFITDRQGVNYPVLMEQPAQPVVAAFRVERFPTLILLDESGKEVWRGEGLSPENRKALEHEIQRRLK